MPPAAARLALLLGLTGGALTLTAPSDRLGLQAALTPPLRRSTLELHKQEGYSNRRRRPLPLFAACSPRRAGQLLACEGANHDRLDAADLNLLQTLMYDAVRQEDYDAASELRDRIAVLTGSKGSLIDWRSLELPEWLVDWLGRLGFAMATRVQMQTLRSIAQRDGAVVRQHDAAIVSPTGSGKTLAYLLPLLRRFSEDFLGEDLARQLASARESGFSERTRAPDAMRRPVFMIVVPSRELGVQVSLLAYRLLGGSPSNPTLQPYAHASRYQPGNVANMFTYTGPRRVKVAGLWDEQGLFATAYQDLLKDAHILIGTPDYLARAAVSGKLRLHQLRAFVVDEADAVLPSESFRMLMRRLSEALEANGTPRPQTILAGASIGSEHVQMAITEGWVKEPVIVTPTEITHTNLSPQGDSVEGDAAKDDKDGSVNEGSDGRTHGAAASSLRAACELSQRVPSGSAHEYIVCDGNDAAIGTCCRLLRRVFTRREEASSADKDATLQPPSDSAAMQESQLVLDAADVNDPPRVVVFTPSADAAISVATRLQAALWADVEGDAAAGLWGLSVLLPSAEQRIPSGLDAPSLQDDEKTLTVLESSLRVMEMFRANQTSVLVTTAAATRGLDFPQVTHVFNLGIVGSDADYVHRAGRVGRIGQRGRGAVLSVLQPDEVPQLLALGGSLHFTPRRVTSPAPTPLSQLAKGGAGQSFSSAFGEEERFASEAAARALEDIYSLYDGVEPEEHNDGGVEVDGTSPS